jgi:hypothetical protein
VERLTTAENIRRAYLEKSRTAQSRIGHGPDNNARTDGVRHPGGKWISLAGLDVNHRRTVDDNMGTRRAESTAHLGCAGDVGSAMAVRKNLNARVSAEAIDTRSSQQAASAKYQDAGDHRRTSGIEPHRRQIINLAAGASGGGR